jgi:hypothetical protein
MFEGEESVVSKGFGRNGVLRIAIIREWNT